MIKLITPSKLKPGFFLIALFFNLFLLKAQTNISGTINIYTPVTFIDTTQCPANITVGSTTGFSVGDSVLIIQMKGAVIDTSNTSSFGNVINLKGAGNYEIGAITLITGNVITLNGKLSNYYNVNGRVQLVRIPTYTSANVNAPLSCPAWNGQTGGVLIFSVQNNLQLNADIDVSGKGFRGGVISVNPDGGCGSGYLSYYYDVNSTANYGGCEKGEGIAYLISSKMGGRGRLASGGGGGNKHNCGGGGGGNFTSGGVGGNELQGCTVNSTGGVGGLGLSTYYNSNKLFVGGGGGRGDDNNAVGTLGENGGGIVIITAGSISGNNNRIIANGNTVTAVAYGIADGAGGGGAGGSIFIKTASVSSALKLMANGGTGGNQNPNYGSVGPGGGGGTGAILTSLSSLTNITNTLLPGAPGLIINPNIAAYNTSYGAAAGASNTTGPLLGKNLVYINPGSAISLSVTGNFTLCKGNSTTIQLSGATTYSWNFGATTPSLVVSPAANISYTVYGFGPNLCSAKKVINITVSDCLGISSITDGIKPEVYPNPFKNNISIKTTKALDLKLYNNLGSLVFEKNLLPGKTEINLDFLPDGIYLVTTNGADGLETGRIIKSQ